MTDKCLKFMRKISQLWSPTSRRVIAGVLTVMALLAALILFFPWDVLRGPVNKYVSEQLGRRFEITQRLSVDLGKAATVRLDGLEFANPDWASEPFLIKAKVVEFDIELWPLILGRVVLPRITLFEPQIGLQIEPDGRKSWALARDTTSANATPDIGVVTVDRGTLKYRATQQGADMTAKFSLVDGAANRLPLQFEAVANGVTQLFLQVATPAASWR